MPIYLYQCLRCDKTVEVTRSITEIEENPKCCGFTTKRVFSLGAVKFNGNGFYSTDNHAI